MAGGQEPAWAQGLAGTSRRIAELDESPLRVLAGPGTGKTFALIRRVARLLQEGAAPGRVLVCTFTRTAEVRAAVASVTGQRSKGFQLVAEFESYCPNPDEGSTIRFRHMSMPRRERFTLNDPWYEPSNIMWWGFLGGIAVGAVGFVLGPTSDFGPLFLLLAMAMWTVALFAMVAFYIGEAWAAFRSARQRADDALRPAERIGEVPSLRRGAWSYALWSRSYERYGRWTRGLLSAGGLLVLLFLALGGLTVRQLALNPAIEHFARAQSCGYEAAITPSENCAKTANGPASQRSLSGWSILR